MTPKLTSFAAGGGCACKIPAGQLESAIAGLIGNDDPNVIVGLEDGDDASAIRINGDTAVISTADFFTPMLTPWAATPSPPSTSWAGPLTCSD